MYTRIVAYKLILQELTSFMHCHFNKHYKFGCLFIKMFLDIIT